MVVCSPCPLHHNSNHNIIIVWREEYSTIVCCTSKMKHSSLLYKLKCLIFDLGVGGMHQLNYSPFSHNDKPWFVIMLQLHIDLLKAKIRWKNIKFLP